MYPLPHLSQLQINHSSIPPSQQYQSHMDYQTSSFPPIAYNSPQSSTQPMTEFPQMDSGLAVPVFNQGDDPIACLNKAMAFLTIVASSRFPSTNNQLRTSYNLRNHATIQDGRVTVQQVQRRQGQSYVGTSYKANATSFGGNNAGGQTRVVKYYNCQGEGYMARQCTQPKRPRNAAWFKEKAMLAKAQKFGQILDEEQLSFLVDPCILDGQAAQNHSKHYVISEVPYFEPYHTDIDNQSAHAMQGFEQTLVVDFTDNEITSDGNIILYSQYLQETQQADVQDTNLYAQQDSMILSMIEQMSKQMINHINNWEKANQEKNNESLTAELERYKERVKTFKQQLSDEQAFWLQTSHPNTDQSASSLFKIEAPKELPKCLDLDPELLNKQNAYNDLSKSYPQLEKHCISLEVTMQPNQEIFQKDSFSDNQNALKIPEYFENNDLKAQLQAKDTIICKLKEHIKSMRENDKEEKVKHEMDEIETINIELEHRQIQEKVFVTTALQNELRKLKGKNVLDNAATITNATTIAPGMFKLDLDPLAPRLLKNRDAHIDYPKYTQDQADILRGIVKQAKEKQPLDNALNFVCKHAKRIHELLVYVRDTCPNAYKPSEKLVAVTPMNKVKKVSFSEPLTSSSNIHKHVKSSKTPDSNTPVLPSIGLKSSTSDSRSQPTDNKKDDRISQTPSSNMKNKSAKKIQQHNIWKPTSKVFTEVGYKWKPTGRLFTIVRNSCPLTRITPTKVVHLQETTSNSVETSKPEIKVYSRRPKQIKTVVVQIVLWYLDSECSKHMTGNRSQLMNFVSKFMGTVRFGNDQIAKIMGYGDYQLGNVIISRVYYVEGLGHNLFSVGQFCDVDLEVAFQKNTYFIQNLEGVDLLSGSRDTNLYTISLDDMLKTSPICILLKASKTKSWLWHRLLSHLNFGILNKLAKDGLARGIAKLKFKKDHLCSACALGNSKKSSHQPKVEDTNQEKLYLLHMDLCGPMRVESINGKKVYLNNGTKFVNQTLSEFYENVGISHQTSVARTPQQNGVVERRNRTLVEVARTMLIFSKALLYLWAKAVNTACYTQNRSLIHLRYNKTPYELMHDKKPDLSFLHAFGSLFYPTNNSKNFGKLNAKADIGIFVGYAPAKKAFRIYNRRTRKIMETIHVTFDELTIMASEQFSLGTRHQIMTPATSSSGLVPNPVPQQPSNPPNRNN
ncbi:retrovirus-related pol polyprotein from transposon TNT 1-94 [Tanacetum coccineum]